MDCLLSETDLNLGGKVHLVFSVTSSIQDEDEDKVSVADLLAVILY